ncbi:hypothetical protein SCYAM73S_07707 [Streptomyces cyaneofuscatus]
MSKLCVVRANSRSSDVTCSVSAMASRKLVSAVCGTTTPLGCPVLPEV